MQLPTEAGGVCLYPLNSGMGPRQYTPFFDMLGINARPCKRAIEPNSPAAESLRSNAIHTSRTLEYMRGPLIKPTGT
jgi:hypothetical protein